MASPDDLQQSPRYEFDVPYAGEESTVLQNLDICLPHPLPPAIASTSGADEKTKGLWIVFIHGGAWRDPIVTSSSFARATQSLLLSSDRVSKIAGLASLSYRLSPYPTHPTHPSSPLDPSRNARHPDHVADVLRALKFLGAKYGVGVGTRYVVVGHSCGATLAMQVADRLRVKREEEEEGSAGPQPAAVVGVAGIYDLPLLVRRQTHPAYREFVTGAFGDDERVWGEASPVSGKWRSVTDRRMVVVLGHSDDDELVDWAQTDAMVECLEREGWECRRKALGAATDAKMDESGVGDDETSSDRVVRMELRGAHDELWQEGTEIVKAIDVAIGLL